MVELGAVDARARAKAAPRLLFALDLVLGARLDVVDGLVRPAAKVAKDFKLEASALVPEKLPRDALNRTAREVVVGVGHVVVEPARLGLVPVVAAHVVDKGRSLCVVVVAKVAPQDLIGVAAHRLPVVRRLHELWKKLVRAAAHLARALDNGGRVRVKDARVDFDKAGRVAAGEPRAVGQELGAHGPAGLRVPAAIGEAVGGDVAAVAVDVLLRKEAADAGREQPDEPDLGPLAVEAAAALLGARGGQQLLERVGKVELVHGISHAGALGLGALNGLARVGIEGAGLGGKGARPRVAKEALSRARVERRLHDGREAVQHNGQVREDEHVGDNVGPPEALFLYAPQLIVPARGRQKVDDAQEQVDGGKEAGQGNLGEEDNGKVDPDADDGRQHTTLHQHLQHHHQRPQQEEEGVHQHRKHLRQNLPRHRKGHVDKRRPERDDEHAQVEDGIVERARVKGRRHKVVVALHPELGEPARGGDAKDVGIVEITEGIGGVAAQG